MSEDSDWVQQRTFAELSTFIISDRSLDDLLTKVASLAVDAIPPAVFAGITMMVDDRVSTQAFTDPTCPQIDQTQYESGHGPCFDSFKHGTIIVVESLGSEHRWPEFAADAIAHGVHSTMSLPMRSSDLHTVGALNLYAGVDRAFGQSEIEVGQRFASQAAAVLINAKAYWGARLQSEHLQLALEGREPIDLAKGIIMNSMGCTPDEAFNVLVRQSQQENRKLRVVAEELVARAARRQVR